MKLTLAQTETLCALAQLSRTKFHDVPSVVSSRFQGRLGGHHGHQGHFEKHWGLMINRTKEKLCELKEIGLARSGKCEKGTDPGWRITVKGAKLAKELA